MGWGDGDIQVSRRRRRRRSSEAPRSSPRLPENARGSPRTLKMKPPLVQFAPGGSPRPSKWSPLSLKIYKLTPLSSEIGFPTGHFPHGRFRAVDSPRFPRGSPKTVINEGFMHVFQQRNAFWGALLELGELFWSSRGMEPQILPNHMNFRWKFIHARRSAAVCVFPRAIFRAVDSFLDPFIPKC